MADNEVIKTAAVASVGLAAGASAAMAGQPLVQLHRAGAAGPANQFAYAATGALLAHATVGQAIGAGLTAVVGGPAVVASAMAAAPFIAFAGAAALTGFGIYKLYESLIES